MKAPPQQHHGSATAAPQQRHTAPQQRVGLQGLGEIPGSVALQGGSRPGMEWLSRRAAPAWRGRNPWKEPEESVATAPGAGLTAPVLFGGVEVNVEKGVHTECADPFSLRCSREGLRWARGRGGDDEVGVDVDEAV